MASTPYQWYNQLVETKSINIFENSSEYFRDFIYVEDVARTVYHLINNYQEGVYDLGTGNPESFEHVANCCLDLMPGAEVYIPMPADLQAQYQKSTCASTDYLEAAGVDVKGFVSVDDGIKEYFNYLKTNKFY
jgi:ADP-L-glycero-D-manno-heptose 6-epimerase